MNIRVRRAGGAGHAAAAKRYTHRSKTLHNNSYVVYVPELIPSRARQSNNDATHTCILTYNQNKIFDPPSQSTGIACASRRNRRSARDRQLNELALGPLTFLGSDGYLALAVRLTTVAVVRQRPLFFVNAGARQAMAGDLPPSAVPDRQPYSPPNCFQAAALAKCLSAAVVLPARA